MAREMQWVLARNSYSNFRQQLKTSRKFGGPSMMNLKTFLAVCALVLATAVRANADPILPGGTISTPSQLGFGGTLLSSPPASNITTSLFSANYSDNVYSDPHNLLCSGCLDFVYQIADIGKTGSVFSLNAYNFAGFETDAGFLSGPGTASPNQITRAADGSYLTFTFNDLGPGDYSQYLVIQTNARSFTAGGVSLQGGPAGNGPGSQPAPSVVPEPSTLLLFGSGLIGLAGVAKRRFGY
jgi:PEP-CTERM motif